MNSYDKSKRTIVRKTTHEHTLRIRLYYERLGIGPKQGWNRDRFYRLCKMVNCTPEELAALCCVFRPAQLAKWLNDDLFPPYVSLSFALIESFWMKSATPVMPLNLLNETKHNHTE